MLKETFEYFWFDRGGTDSHNLYMVADECIKNYCEMVFNYQQRKIDSLLSVNLLNKIELLEKEVKDLKNEKNKNK